MARRCRGFSLIEVMMVVAILGVMATLAIGAMNTVFQRRQFDQVVRGTSDVFLQARYNALRTGKRTAVSIENRMVVAFIDSNKNQEFDASEPLIARYPHDAGSHIPDGIELDCVTLRERGSGPRTAYFDGRGFYIDGHDGVSRHEANLCVTEAATQREKTIAISLFGNVAPAGDACEKAPFVCPNVAPD